MRTRSLANLISDVRLRTKMEHSTFVTDEEITEYLNQENTELWGHVTQGSGQPFIRAESPISVLQGQAIYPLPADFWEAQEVTAVINGTEVTLTNFMPRQRARLSARSLSMLGSPVRYRIQGDNIEFQPASFSFPATLFYTPSCPRLTGTFDADGALVSSTDVFDGWNGFEMASIYGVCATVREMEEKDPSFFVGQKDRIYRHIDSLIATRDAGMPERVQDVVGGLGDACGDDW